MNGDTSKTALEDYFGIDFGTTNCATAGVLDDAHGNDQIETFGDDQGRPIPSVVAIDHRDGTVYTGREAWSKKNELAQSCTYVASVKTRLDQDEKHLIAGKVWTNVEIASELLKALKQSVKDHGHQMDEAVIAVPVSFGVEKRRNLRKAAEMAGIHVKTFVSEPTAAYFANYEELQNVTNTAVFDWGGGTLDISIIRNENNCIYELATDRMDLAGDDIDKKLAERIHARIALKHPEVTEKLNSEDMESKSRDLLRVRAERAKCDLSEMDTANLRMNRYGQYGSVNESVDYEWFKEIITPEVNMAVERLQNTIQNSGVGIANIDRILMVGGSSNLRPLLERMVEVFDKDILYFPDDSTWSVAEGAAMLSKYPGKYYSNQDLGLLMSDGSRYPLLKKGDDLNHYERKDSFGVTDNTGIAHFVFTGSQELDQSADRYLTYKGLGFLQERLDTKVFVDQDLVVNVIVQSSMLGDDHRETWQYPGLKIRYQLPEQQGQRGAYEQ